MSPKPDVSTERKRQISQAALACFAENGYHQTTMDDIVKASGLSKGALYWYFESKKDLFLFLIDDLMAELNREWGAIAASESASPTEKILASMAYFQAEVDEFIPLLGVLMEAWALSRHDEDVVRLTRGLYQPYQEVLVDVIEEGIASGEFQVTNPEATSLVIMAFLDGLALAMAGGFVGSDWRDLAGAAEEVILRGLGVEDGRER
jgi:AcrR family transcriptional regulator